MKKAQFFLLLCVAVFATGCPKYKPSVNFSNSSNFAKQVNAHFEQKQKDYFGAIAANDPTTAKLKRNELIEDALPYIDDAYTDFINDIEAGRDRTNFVADVVELSAAAATGIIKGSQRPIQIVGIALTAFKGGRRSADLNFYKEQTTAVLISKMDGNRAKVRTTILTREREGVDTYNIGAAISDIVAYYNAGTLVRAFTELQKDTAAETKQTEDNLTEAKRHAGILGAPTEEEIRVSRENAGAVDALIDAYETASDQVDAADTKLADANQRIASADPAIDKAKASTDKTKAETDKATAKTAQDAALKNLKGTYEAIEGDPALSPLLDKIPDLPGYSADFKTHLQQSLQRLKQRTATVDDYALILLQVGKVVRLNLSKDPTLNERLQTILKVNK